MIKAGSSATDFVRTSSCARIGVVNILIVSQYYAPDITAAAFRISETAALLRLRLHDVKVITTEPHKSEMTFARQADAAEGVHRVPVAAYAGGGLVAYLVQYLSFVARAIIAGLRLRKTGWRPEVVWVTSPPLFAGLAGWILSRTMRAPMVLDIRDIWPESAVAAGQLSQDGAGFRLGKLLERFLYDRAAAVTCVSNPMCAYIATRTRTPATVVYNGVLVGNAPDPAPEQTRDRILYAGNLGRVQGLEVLLQAFARLSAKGLLSGWTLDLIGTGAQEAALKAQASGLECRDTIRFHRPMPKAQALAEIACSRLLFINLMDQDVFDLTIPSKVFDYMLMNRPILCGVGGEGLAIIEETGGNVPFTPSDVDSLCDAIERAAANMSHYEALAAGNSRIVRDRYSREAATDALEGVFAAVLGRTPNGTPAVSCNDQATVDPSSTATACKVPP